jgi:hypothetical protein
MGWGGDRPPACWTEEALLQAMQLTGNRKFNAIYALTGTWPEFSAHPSGNGEDYTEMNQINDRLFIACNLLPDHPDFRHAVRTLCGCTPYALSGYSVYAWGVVLQERNVEASENRIKKLVKLLKDFRDGKLTTENK